MTNQNTKIQPKTKSIKTSVHPEDGKLSAASRPSRILSLRRPKTPKDGAQSMARSPSTRRLSNRRSSKEQKSEGCFLKRSISNKCGLSRSPSKKKTAKERKPAGCFLLRSVSKCKTSLPCMNKKKAPKGELCTCVRCDAVRRGVKTNTPKKTVQFQNPEIESPIPPQPITITTPKPEPQQKTSVKSYDDDNNSIVYSEIIEVLRSEIPLQLTPVPEPLKKKTIVSSVGGDECSVYSDNIEAWDLDEESLTDSYNSSSFHTRILSKGKLFDTEMTNPVEWLRIIESEVDDAHSIEATDLSGTTEVGSIVPIESAESDSEVTVYPNSESDYCSNVAESVSSSFSSEDSYFAFAGGRGVKYTDCNPSFDEESSSSFTSAGSVAFVKEETPWFATASGVKLPMRAPPFPEFIEPKLRTLIFLFN